MNEDQVKGAVKKITGKVLEQAGKLLKSENCQIKGIKKQVVGKAQYDYGNAKEAVKKLYVDRFSSIQEGGGRRAPFHKMTKG